VPFAFRSPEETTFRHGADLIGLARWVLAAGRHAEALRLLRRAVDLGLPDDLLFRTLWDIGTLEKRLGQPDAALAIFTDLAASRNVYRVRALRELAMHYEHRERNYAMALEMTHSALALEDSADLRRRERRLREKKGADGLRR
jgi:tetratricopeptide (TPR) repeat protein